MDATLPFFNWSLKRLLDTESGTFNLARIRILFTILLLSLIKVCIVVVIAWQHEQTFQLQRAVIALVLYLGLLKFLLINKRYVTVISHIMLWLGVLIICSNIFVAAHGVNIVTLQFVFMAMVSSFYLLNKRMGVFYSVIAVLPVLIFLLLPDKMMFGVSAPPQELAAPGQLILILFNFLTLIVAHYIYHLAFSVSLMEKEQLNSQLEIAVKEATKLAQSKSDFLSTMSHELRTPLNAVIGITDLMLYSPHGEEQKEQLDILRFSAVSLSSLINDILDFNKLDSERVQLEQVPMHLPELVQGVCAGLNMLALEKGLQLELETDARLQHVMVSGDATRLRQVMYNLVGNAVKFTEKGKVTVSAQCTDKGDGSLTVQFSVTDTGIGIPEDKQVQIFEPFVQASASITRKYGGTGLGLPIVRGLLRLFHSEVHLESKAGIGSRFYFDIRFPYTAMSDSDMVPVSPLTFNLNGLRVLVAEDNPLNHFLVKSLLGKWQGQVTLVSNGQEALDAIKQQVYDVVLMDIHMPVMEGYEAVKHIRQLEDKQKAKIYIIALTASVSDHVEEKVKAAGMDDYMLKPFDINELYRKLKGVAQLR